MSTSSKLMRLSKQLSMLRPGDGYQSKWVILWKNMYITLKMGTSTLCLEYRDLKAFQRLLERRANLLSFTNTVCLIALLASFAMRRSLWDSSWWIADMISGWITQGAIDTLVIINISKLTRQKMSSDSNTGVSRLTIWQSMTNRQLGITSWTLQSKRSWLTLGIAREQHKCLQHSQKTGTFSDQKWRQLSC